MFGTAASGSINISVAQALASVKQLQRELQNLQSTSAKPLADPGFENVANQVAKVEAQRQMLGRGLLATGVAMGGTFLAGLNGAVKLEQGIANVNAALGGVDAGTLDQLSASFQQIGVDSQFSAVEVAAVGEQLAKAGFSIEEMMGGATKAVVDLSQATGADLTTSVDGIVQAMSVWDPALVGVENGLTDASRAADILTIASNKSQANVGDIIAGMRPLGPIAAQMGIGYDEAAAAIAVFTDAGLKGADSGISLARGLQNLADPTSEAAGLMTDLGIAAFDSQGTFVGFPSLFTQLQKSMGGMSDQAQLTALSTIFGAEAMDVMGLAILNGAGPIEEMIKLMGESGAAAEQSALRMDTLGMQFGTLREGVMTLLASFVQGLIPGFRFLVDGANLVVNALMRIPGPIKTVIGALLGIGAIVATVAGAMILFGPQIGAITAILGGMVAPMLAVIAVAVALYAAWKTNLFGIRDLTKKALGPVTRFIDRFQAAWDALKGPSDAMKTIERWGGIVRDAAGYTNTLSMVLSALGTAIRGIGGGDIGWINTIADGFEGAAKYVQKFVDAWNSFDANNGISDTMRTVNEWGNKTAEQMGTFDRLVATLGQMGGAAKVLGGVLGFIGDHFDTIAKAVGIAVGAFVAFKIAVGVVALVAGAIALLTSPIFLVIAGVALLATAWSQNWGDIQGKTAAVVGWLTGTAWPAVTGFVSDIVGAAGAIKAAWDGNLGGVRSSIENTIAALQHLWNEAMRVKNAVSEFFEGFGTFAWFADKLNIEFSLPDWDWPSLPEWSWPDWNWPSLPNWSWPGLPDWIWPDWSWPSLPDWSWPDLSWPDWGWPDFPSFSWPSLPDWAWPSLPSFSWPDWSWPELPSFSWPGLPSFSWPSLPTWSWPGLPLFSWPSWNWPALPSFSWPSLPSFAWPALPTFSWPNLPSWTWSSLPTFSWPSLPTFSWPALPKFTWPNLPTFTWPTLPTWTWPGLPAFSWPSLPTWTWPSIPMPDWWGNPFGGGGGEESAGISPVATGIQFGGGAELLARSAKLTIDKMPEFGAWSQGLSNLKLQMDAAKASASSFSLTFTGSRATIAADLAAIKASVTTNIGGLPMVIAPPIAAVKLAFATGFTGISTTVGTQFTAIKTSAALNIGGLPLVVAPALLAVNAAFSGGLTGLSLIAATQFGAVKTSATTQTSAMAAGVGLSIAGMGVSVATGMAAMALGAVTQTAAMSTGVCAAVVGMNLAIAATLAGTTALVLVQFAAMNQSGTAQVTSLQGNVSAAMSAIRSSVASQTAAAASAASAGFNRIASAAQSGMASATGAIRGATGQWAGIVGSAAGAMSAAGFRVGNAAGMGVASGLNSASGAVAAASANIISIVNRTMNAAAMIASPSRLTARIGALLTAGVGVGMTAPAALRGLGSAAGQVIDTAFGDLSLSQKDRDLIGLARDIINRRDGQESASQALMGQVSRQLAMIGGDATPPGIATMAKQLKGMSERSPMPGITRPIAKLNTTLTNLDRTLGKTVSVTSPYADLFRDRTRLSATDFSVRNGRFTEHYGAGTPGATIVNNDNRVVVNNPTLEEKTWLEHQDMARRGKQVAAVAQRGQARTMAQTGHRAPVRRG